jgi:hypothetical protein
MDMSKMRMRSKSQSRTGTRSMSARLTSGRSQSFKRSNRLRAQAKWKTSMIRMFLGTLILLLVLFIGYWIFRIFDPFYSFSPFIKDITVGESVLGSWHYGGVDASGNLRFYHDTNGFQTVLIPANLGRFAADGTYVILLHHSPVSLAFETPGNYMMQMLFQSVTILAVIGVVFLLIAQLAFRKSKGAAFRPSKQKRK